MALVMMQQSLAYCPLELEQPFVHNCLFANMDRAYISPNNIMLPWLLKHFDFPVN